MISNFYVIYNDIQLFWDNMINDTLTGEINAKSIVGYAWNEFYVIGQCKLAECFVNSICRTSFTVLKIIAWSFFEKNKFTVVLYVQGCGLVVWVYQSCPWWYI